MYEKTSIDEFYMDLTGMDKFFGCYKLATELRQKIIKETNLPISFAMSANKTVSKVGTGEAKPNGQKEILFGTEKEFLAPLSIKKIPMVGDKTYQLLRGMGVMWIRTLQEMPMELLQQVLGENGAVIWRKAQGIDNSPVVPYSERKSISTERTFEQDTIDVKMLKGLLIGMTEKLAYQLRSEQKLTACVTVKIRYSDFNTYTMQARIPYSALDHVLIDKVKELFDKLYQKRMLIRLIGIRFSHLVHGGHQYNLFDQTPEQIQLYMAMDKIRKRYGDEAVARAVGTDFKRTEMNPFNGIKR
jgi:DNA polymerase IV